MPVFIRTQRRDETGAERRADFASRHIRAVKPTRVIPWLLIVRRFETYQCREFRAVGMSELKDDAAADGATEDDRAAQPERAAESSNRFYVELGRQFVS